MSEKACEDGRVLEYFDMAECIECGTRVRWDLRDHPFFGFQNCRERPPSRSVAVDPVEGIEQTGPRATPDLIP